MRNPKPPRSGPPLSVVMPVYNALPHLDVAIESILAQTFSDFEFVILDDSSTDGSSERLRQWAATDSRIRLDRVKENLGPALSSNAVASAASAPIVARMDADDISHPDRLREQLEAIEADPDVGVVGTLAEIIDSSGRKIRDGELWRLTRDSWFVPFAHGAMMYRRSVFEQVGGYREQCVFWEDQDLVTRMAAVSKVMVIPKPLYQVRQSASSTRFTSGHESLERALDLMYRGLDRLDRGEGYDDVLTQPVPDDSRIDPRSYVSLGSVILWAGKRPRLFGRMLKRARLAPDFRSASALLWTAWASVSPGTLRPFLLLLLKIRNSYAKSHSRTDSPILWSQPRQLPLARQRTAGEPTARSA